MTLHHGDCIEVMAGMPDASVDAIVTDPPYGLGFMGKAWDHGVPARPFWEQMLRVAKPSAYLLAFGGTRTVHRIATNIEDAGWVIRDMLVWAYASGFPKSKASLKPAWEPIVMARKPGPLRMLAIDECRIPFAGDESTGDRDGEATAETRYTLDGGTNLAAKPGRRIVSDRAAAAAAAAGYAMSRARGTNTPSQSIGRESRDGTNAYDPFAIPGRWPANVVLTDPIFDGGVEGVVGGGETSSGSRSGEYASGGFLNGSGPVTAPLVGDSGTYSRFFLIPKADRTDREPVLGGLPSGFEPTMGNGIGGREHDPADRRAYLRNVHPTVKPTDLMRHLIRLVTPTGGTVLDPFLGSGTTALAAEMEGFAWIGIEREAEYVAIAEARLNGTQRGLGLETA